MSFKDVGKVATITQFENILQRISPPVWANSVTIHHTAAPSLSQRPKGFTAQHINNMRDYYQSLGWKSGPHLYIDDDQIWFMTPLTERGIHAASFNSRSIGIEVLGNYDSEDAFTGRGLQCWQLAAKTTMQLLNWLNLKPSESTVLFHREDPRTSKTCPGTKITKKWLLRLIDDTFVMPATIKPIEVSIIEKLPVIDYVVNNCGYTEAEAIKLLTNKKGMFFFGNDWLEGASYDAKLGATIAPISELQQITSRKTS